MPNKPLILLCALLLGTKAPAQHPDDEYYPYEPRAEERAPELVVDTSLFYRAVQTGDDLFAAQTDYTLSFVAAKRRGAEPGAEPASLCGIGIPMRYATALRLVGFEERRYAELNGETLRPGSAADSREFAWPEGLRAASRSLAAGFSDRNYLARIRMTVGGPLGRGWSGTAAADLRTGRDMHVRGVFTEAATAACALRKQFGDDCDLLLTVVLPAGSYGMRTSSVEEYAAHARPLPCLAGLFGRACARHADDRNRDLSGPGRDQRGAVPGGAGEALCQRQPAGCECLPGMPQRLPLLFTKEGEGPCCMRKSATPAPGLANSPGAFRKRTMRWSGWRASTSRLLPTAWPRLRRTFARRRTRPRRRREWHGE